MTSSIWLRDLASYSLQIALLVCAGAALAQIFRLRIPTATLAFWRTLLVACLLLPVCQPWKERVDSSHAIVTRSDSAPSFAAAALRDPGPSSRSTTWPLEDIVLLALAAGIAARGVWLAVGSLSLRNIRRNSALLPPLLPSLESVQRQLCVHADFYTSDRTTGPITFGLARPVIILPLSILKMEPRIQKAVIYHELLHVRRRDWIFAVMEECIRTILWFHPAIWWLIGRIQLCREQVVDQAVIRLIASREQYVEALLAVALTKTRTQLIPAPLFLRRSLLKKRVAEIFKETTMSKRQLIFCLAMSFCVILVAAVAAVRMFPLEAHRQESNSAPIQVVRGGEYLLHGERFEYPRRAFEKRVEGDVLLEVSVDERGQVSDARVLSGPEELRRAALQSVLQWHYSPAMALPATTQALIRFRLPSEGAPKEVLFEKRPYIAMLEEEKKERSSTAQGVERAIKEIQEGLANPNASAEEKEKLNHQLAELKEDMEKIQAEREQRGGAFQAERIERAMKEVQEGLANPNTPAEARARLKRQLEELNSARLARSYTSGTPLKLTQVRTERVSETAVKFLYPRLGIRVGDMITEETGRRIRETVASIDEHLRVSFHPDANGGVTLVIAGPQ